MGTLIKCIMINKQQGACGTNLSNLTNDLSASSSTTLIVEVRARARLHRRASSRGVRATRTRDAPLANVRAPSNPRRYST